MQRKVIISFIKDKMPLFRKNNKLLVKKIVAKKP